jgi:hypothetical protein
MHFGIEVVTLGEYADPRPVVRLARAAEAAGWEGLFIWVGGDSRPAYRRAARRDGWVIGGVNEQGNMTLTPAQMAEKVAAIRRIASIRSMAAIQPQRDNPAPFEVAMTGYSTPADGALAREFCQAGVTWWLESLHGYRGTFDEMLARVKGGPPK